MSNIPSLKHSELKQSGETRFSSSSFAAEASSCSAVLFPQDSTSLSAPSLPGQSIIDRQNGPAMAALWSRTLLYLAMSSISLPAPLFRTLQIPRAMAFQIHISLAYHPRILLQSPSVHPSTTSEIRPRCPIGP